jgi:hypothetical protein
MYLFRANAVTSALKPMPYSASVANPVKSDVFALELMLLRLL